MKLFFNKLLYLAVILFIGVACSKEQLQAQTISSEMVIYITIEGMTMPVKLIDNEATRKLVDTLKKSTITYEADDYGNFEKVGPLGLSLPSSNKHITTQPGDVVLYSGNQIVLFYGENSWSYTPLGRIEYASLDELKMFLKAGQGRVSVTLSNEESTGISTVNIDHNDERIFASNGMQLKHEPANGLFIKNGKKYIR
jgi:hypothetical protein